MKEILAGHEFYKAKGFKTVVAHLAPNLHEGLVKYAKAEDRSLNKVVNRIIEKELKKLGYI